MVMVMVVVMVILRLPDGQICGGRIGILYICLMVCWRGVDGVGAGIEVGDT